MARSARPDAACPMNEALDMLSGKWKLAILWHLSNASSLRFNELQRRLGGVTQKTLTGQLRELEEDGVISRQVFAEVPPRVEYALTERGRAARPVLDALCEWGKSY